MTDQGGSHGRRDSDGHAYDAVLYLSFGGPESPDEVIPFLERVTAGRDVPRERLEEVAEHYHLFGGVSPINAQNRAVIAGLRELLARDGPDLPVYWGNRNWHPLLADTVAAMRADGVERAAAFVTAPVSSYSSCRQYREDIVAARAAVGETAPEIDKLRVFFNHPGFIDPQAQRVRVALAAVPVERRPDTRLVFTAHSIPMSMAKASDYEAQLREACRLVSERVPSAGADAHDEDAAGQLDWELVWQSRSGPPHIPWLAPDVGDHLHRLADEGVDDVVVVPIGFVSDHLEVAFDLDVEAAEIAAERGLNMVRASTVGAHPRYVAMIRDLVVERASTDPEPVAVGDLGPSHDICDPGCCRDAQR